MSHLHLSGQEITFSPDDIIVSKTDTKGLITYTNSTFCKISGYTEKELLGQPHNIIRHAAMPRCVFKLVWDYVQTGREMFGYLLNRTKDNDYYWVLAQITPSYDKDHTIVGYHSNRRITDQKIVSGIISPLYSRLLEIEQRPGNRKDGMMLGYQHLLETLGSKGMDYDEFILSL